MKYVTSERGKTQCDVDESKNKTVCILLQLKTPFILRMKVTLCHLSATYQGDIDISAIPCLAIPDQGTKEHLSN
jgi:hypothetical protein